MADKGITIKIDGEALAQTFRKMSESLRRLRVEAVTYDENTMIKVRRALENVLGGVQEPTATAQIITDCITEMQNEGILFRERS